MVDLSRRKTVLGLGMLAVGSGSVFTSAAFSDEVNPTSDMRVVVDEELTLEPGVLFRDGSGVDDDFDPAVANSSTNNGESIFNNSSTSLFGGNNNAGLEDINTGDLPAASANDATNGAIELEVGIPLDDDGQIGSSSAGVFQVINDTTSPQKIGIRFDDFGADASFDGNNNPDDLTGNEVFDTFQFVVGSGPSTQISSDGYSTPSPSSNINDQNLPNTTTVSAGGDIQIYIEYDTTSSAAKGAIETAADGPGSSPFSSPANSTVDLVDTLDVGVEP